MCVCVLEWHTFDIIIHCAGLSQVMGLYAERGDDMRGTVCV